MSVAGKKILLGISGSIAAYKTCELVRLFKKNGADVRVIMTPSAAQFVSPVTLSTLSGNEVAINMFPQGNVSETETIETKTWHIYSGLWADVYLIAPATANTIAKLANGISDNFLPTTALSVRCPIIISPAMDEDMLNSEITQINISKLREIGYWVIEPESGELASGLKGIGRMPEPETIFKYTDNFLQGNQYDFKDKKVLITAGPTYEPIDDVRYIGNYSTGKMGFSLAKAAMQRGAEVTLISGHSMLQTPRNVNRIDIKTAEEMFNAVKNNLNGIDYFIMSAAVADYKPEKKIKGKIKKDTGSNLVINTVKTIDILQYAGENKKGFKLAGFALESENEIENAKDKIKAKNLDIIVVNNPNVAGAGFGTNTNVITILDKEMNVFKYDKMSKFDAAMKILDSLVSIK
ncbi:MAG TPA: bifunctional phosphopantothenoylcysteine decarboxylase/phosphopantothenate--cysteine ligase CoaBC [Ignavibacteria bacterium]|nr:bifunctional phosphopantothenoylcysteine decarboxylase/phosphopantothenate--cysteine ligase CoaBC [Ignavibacteria bacterium]